MGKALLIKGSKNNHLSLKRLLLILACLSIECLRKKTSGFLYILVSFSWNKLKKILNKKTGSFDPVFLSLYD
ncbi:hypothetical protein OCUAc17_36560 [Acinetobacter pittii]|nr:hypothetical protein OCUAc17_36560 [Acinetobacter pittii]